MRMRPKKYPIRVRGGMFLCAPQKEFRISFEQKLTQQLGVILMGLRLGKNVSEISFNANPKPLPNLAEV